MRKSLNMLNGRKPRKPATPNNNNNKNKNNKFINITYRKEKCLANITCYLWDMSWMVFVVFVGDGYLWGLS